MKAIAFMLFLLPSFLASDEFFFVETGIILMKKKNEEKIYA